MEIISSNDGLLTNIEVCEVIKENRTRRSKATAALAISLQNRELVESKVKFVVLQRYGFLNI
jgi:hypothetical protein